MLKEISLRNLRPQRFHLPPAGKELHGRRWLRDVLIGHRIAGIRLVLDQDPKAELADPRDFHLHRRDSCPILVHREQRQTGLRYPELEEAGKYVPQEILRKFEDLFLDHLNPASHKETFRISQARMAVEWTLRPDVLQFTLTGNYPYEDESYVLWADPDEIELSSDQYHEFGPEKKFLKLHGKKTPGQPTRPGDHGGLQEFGPVGDDP